MRAILEKLFCRRRFCACCVNQMRVSNFSPCYTCKQGSNFCDPIGSLRLLARLEGKEEGNGDLSRER